LRQHDSVTFSARWPARRTSVRRAFFVLRSRACQRRRAPVRPSVPGVAIQTASFAT